MIGVVVLDVDIGVLVVPDEVVVVLGDVDVGAVGCAGVGGVCACPRWPAKAGALTRSIAAVTPTAVRVKRIRIPPVAESEARHVPSPTA
jgi:hypothetical protein